MTNEKYQSLINRILASQIKSRSVTLGEEFIPYLEELAGMRDEFFDNYSTWTKDERNDFTFLFKTYRDSIQDKLDVMEVREFFGNK